MVSGSRRRWNTGAIVWTTGRNVRCFVSVFRTWEIDELLVSFPNIIFIWITLFEEVQYFAGWRRFEYYFFEKTIGARTYQRTSCSCSCSVELRRMSSVPPSAKRNERQNTSRALTKNTILALLALSLFIRMLCFGWRVFLYSSSRYTYLFTYSLQYSDMPRRYSMFQLG